MLRLESAQPQTAPTAINSIESDTLNSLRGKHLILILPWAQNQEKNPPDGHFCYPLLTNSIPGDWRKARIDLPVKS